MIFCVMVCNLNSPSFSTPIEIHLRLGSTLLLDCAFDSRLSRVATCYVYGNQSRHIDICRMQLARRSVSWLGQRYVFILRLALWLLFSGNYFLVCSCSRLILYILIEDTVALSHHVRFLDPIETTKPSARSQSPCRRFPIGMVCF